jgi:uncharacterized protein (DUF1015 family)
VDYADGIVFRHEQTLSGPKADRLELLRHTRAHTGQLFMLYDDPSREVDSILEISAAGPAAMKMQDEYGVVHSIWRIERGETISAIKAAMADKKLVIADGHHRYETALAYRNEQRARKGASDVNAPYEKVMMTLVNSHSEGLTILPTHRVVSGLTRFDPGALRLRLSEHFEIRDVPLPEDSARRAATAREQLSKAGSSGRALGLFAGGDNLDLLVLKPGPDLASTLRDSTPSQRGLDVVLLHSLILGKGLGITAEAVRQEQNVRYEREAIAAMEAVSEGRAQACFLLNPVHVEQVMSMALAGDVLPQKSTDFYPKMLSGMTIYRLE